MINTCEYCEYERLITSEEGRNEYVGCIKTDGYAYEDREIIMKFLDDIYYTGKTVSTGWIYTSYPDHDEPENGNMISTCLMMEKNAKCKFFEERC